MSITAPEPSRTPRPRPNAQRQMRQAEELLFSGPSRSGFAKALFRGEFRGDVLFPYPELPPDEQAEADEAVAAVRRVRRRAHRRGGDRPRGRHPRRR